VTRWLPPIPVKVDLEGVELVPTIRPGIDHRSLKIPAKRLEVEKEPRKLTDATTRETATPRMEDAGEG
jgi:hypothetical protein